MGLKIGASGFAIVILLAACLFAQDQGTKPDNESQAAHKAQARQPHRIHVKENAQKAKLVNTVSSLYQPFLGKRVDGTVVNSMIKTSLSCVTSGESLLGRSTYA